MKQRLSILGAFLVMIVLASCASKGGGTESSGEQHKGTSAMATDTARLSDPRYR